MTLGQAIEKVGVGGRVRKDGHHYEHVVTAVGEKIALLKYMGNLNQYEEGQDLNQEGWSQVLPKKRVVLHAWEYKPTGGIFWYEHAPRNALIEDYAHRTDIPKMIFEDGKQVFE